MESIIVALIAGGLSLVGTIITVQNNNQKIIRDMKAEFSKEMQEIKTEFVKSKAITDTKLDDLAQEVRRHNNFAERVPMLEQRIEGIDEKIGIFHKN